MTAPTRAEQLATAANETAAGWFALDAKPGAFHKCESGGWLVNVGEPLPVWREDMGAVRRLLLERDLMVAEVSGS